MRQTLARIFYCAFLINATVASAEVAVLFSPNGGAKAAIIEQLSTATKRVDVAMYSFSDSDIQNQLIELSHQRIAVRVILDKARDKAAIADKLEESGIDVRYLIPVMHHKFAVIDGPRGTAAVPQHSVLITGSANWSKSSDSSYDEDLLIFRDEPKKIASYQSEFDYLWDHARDYEGSAVSESTESVEWHTDSSTIFTSANFEAIESRGNWAFRPIVEAEQGAAGIAIIEAIRRAERSLSIATTHLRRKDIYEALLAAHQRGVAVSMVLDQQEYRSLSTERTSANPDVFYDEKLAKAGVNVRYKVYMVSWDARQALQMHSKYMVVDSKTVLTGSFNWSANSEVGSFENLNILRGRIVNDYEANFKAILNYGGESAFVALLNTVKGNGGESPCRFTPVTLTGTEFEKLRRSYKSGACRRD